MKFSVSVCGTRQLQVKIILGCSEVGKICSRRCVDPVPGEICAACECKLRERLRELLCVNRSPCPDTTLREIAIREAQPLLKLRSKHLIAWYTPRCASLGLDKALSRALLVERSSLIQSVLHRAAAMSLVLAQLDSVYCKYAERGLRSSHVRACTHEQETMVMRTVQS